MVEIYNSKELADFSDELMDVVINSFKYNFIVKHVCSKANEVADYLSRHPKWENNFGNNTYLEDHIKMASTTQRNNNRILQDLMIGDLCDKAIMDKSYTSVIQSIREKQSKEEIKQSSTEDPERQYLHLWDRLGLLDDREDTLVTSTSRDSSSPKEDRKKYSGLYTSRTRDSFLLRSNIYYY